MKLINKIKSFLLWFYNKIKSIFYKETDVVEEQSPEADIEVDVNNPIDINNIKKGEIGGYVIYDKRTAIIDETFINNLKELGIDILYLNTPRDKSNPETLLTFDEWLEIFEKFKDSGIKIMLYIFETMTLSNWTNSQIKQISNHPAFYGWIALDEVTYKSYSSSNAWITKFHNQKISEERKWPNISVCYLPKLNSLSTDYIGENYDDYLELWSDSMDIALADMYPFIALKKDNAHYNIEEDGEPVYSNTSGGEQWVEYLQSHLKFTNNHPELTHRLYMHTCKHIVKDANGKQYLNTPKPTEKTLKIQAYANLMSGSNGLMLFVLGDIDTRFHEAAFNLEFKPNESSFNLIKKVFTTPKFKAFKDLIVNLHIDEIKSYTYGTINEDLEILLLDSDVLVSTAHNNENDYFIILNKSLTDNTVIKVNSGYCVLDLVNHLKEKVDISKFYLIEPGEILIIKKDGSN